MIMLLITEIMLFSGLISSYFYLRGAHRVWPPFGASELSTAVPAVATAVIAASSAALLFAQVSVRRADTGGTRIGLGMAVFMGAVFLAAMVHEWTVTDVKISQGIFGGTYYLLTGAHMLHVAVGIGFLVNAFAGSLQGRYTAKSHFGISAAGIYWHFVTIVWMILFPVVYLY